MNAPSALPYVDGAPSEHESRAQTIQDVAPEQFLRPPLLETADRSSESRAQPAPALLKVILVLLILNLGATAYLIFGSRGETSVSSIPAPEPLPEELTSGQGKTALYDKLAAALNARDSDGLWAMIDPSVRLQMKAQWDQAVPTIFSITGKIEDGAFSHYEYAGESNGKKVFFLYYSLLTDRGPASLRVTVAKAMGEPYTLWGFNVNTGQQ